jgi:hypothetical protein
LSDESSEKNEPSRNRERRTAGRRVGGETGEANSSAPDDEGPQQTALDQPAGEGQRREEREEGGHPLTTLKESTRAKPVVLD